MFSPPRSTTAALTTTTITTEEAVVVAATTELQRSVVMRWLMQFAGFRERLLADDLFLAKLAMECGVGFFTQVSAFSFLSTSLESLEHFGYFLAFLEKFIEKTAAEYERRRENFFNELEVVFADVIIVVITSIFLKGCSPR
ncbi:hypothetical protein HID58_086505 [Brassica napus]|uniref:Uncharacterized protein n=1 Tax=Brassica napus TaxID=3708 RepID=A0ABQ7XQH5_BRANA|nr:hypothetical protein HID58_086505 [Brassica napus]